jgi:hypothetical protein
MPAGNLNTASPSSVLPKMNFTSFTEGRIYPALQNNLNDGTILQSLIQDGVNTPESVKTWNCSVRLTADQVTALQNFFVSVNGPQIPFYFYNPWEQQPGTRVGTNYDASGDSEQGRHTVRFTNPTLVTATTLPRTNITFGLMEVN